jgi:hypothetical protein
VIWAVIEISALLSRFARAFTELICVFSSAATPSTSCSSP